MTVQSLSLHHNGLRWCGCRLSGASGHVRRGTLNGRDRHDVPRLAFKIVLDDVTIAILAERPAATTGNTEKHASLNQRQQFLASRRAENLERANNVTLLNRVLVVASLIDLLRGCKMNLDNEVTRKAIQSRYAVFRMLQKTEHRPVLDPVHEVATILEQAFPDSLWVGALVSILLQEVLEDAALPGYLTSGCGRILHQHWLSDRMELHGLKKRAKRQRRHTGELRLSWLYLPKDTS